jgi:hypothetical protein
MQPRRNWPTALPGKTLEANTRRGSLSTRNGHSVTITRKLGMAQMAEGFTTFCTEITPADAAGTDIAGALKSRGYTGP